MELRLVPVTADNWKKAIFLTTDASENFPIEERWIASNTFSLLQCHYDADWDCRLMMDGEKAVGFVFYGYWRERDHHLICRYMVDFKEQGKGYGSRFLPLVADQIRGQYGCEDVYVTVSDENAAAVHLYQKAGFVLTDEMDEEERVYVLRGK